MPPPEVFWSSDGTRAILVNVTMTKGSDSNLGSAGKSSGAARDAGGAAADGTSKSSVNALASAEAHSSSPSPLPLSHPGRGNKKENPGAEEADEASIVEYEVSSGRWKVLEPLIDKSKGTPRYVKAVGWLKPDRELLVTHEMNGQPAEGTLYSFTPSGVESRTVDASVNLPTPGTGLAGGLTVKLVQSANDPPRVIASNGTREAVLTGPDPALKNVRLQRTEPFQWHEPDGKTVTGGLTLPPASSKDSPSR